MPFPYFVLKITEEVSRKEAGICSVLLFWKHERCKKKTEAVLVANEAASLEINTDKMEYIFTLREQNVRQNCKIKININP